MYVKIYNSNVFWNSGSVLNGELYAQRSQKLIYLHVFTDFHEDFSSIVGINPVASSTIYIPYIQKFGGLPK